MKEIAIIGAGSWGTALALARRVPGIGCDCGARREVAVMLKRERENKIYLAGFKLPDSIEPTNDWLKRWRARSSWSPSCRRMWPRGLHADEAALTPGDDLCQRHERHRDRHADANRRGRARCPARSLRGAVPSHCPGPTFALEVARDEQPPLYAAAHTPAWAESAQAALSSRRFRIYTNNDVVGVEIGGAVKTL